MSDEIQTLHARSYGGDPYDALDEVVKVNVSRKEWLWMSDAEKHRFFEQITTPEHEE